VNRTDVGRTVAAIVVLLWLIVSGSDRVQSQSKRTIGLQTRTKKLELSVKKLSNEQRSLDARIAALEQLNLNPKPGEFYRHYVQAHRDGISFGLINIAANAYQYKIRPSTLGGGAGRYTGYHIPSKMSSSNNASFSVTVFSDSIVLVGKSLLNLGTVQAAANDTGRTGHWKFTGKFE